MTQTIVVTGSKDAVDPDDVLIQVGDRELSGWTSVRVSAGMERCPRDFELGATDYYPAKAEALVAKPGDACSVFIGKDRVVTGYLNRHSATISARGHAISLLGRGMCQDLVDCAAEWKGQQISGASVRQVAEVLSAVFGITVVGEDGPAVGQGGKTLIPQLVLMLGETAWEVIERLARIAGLLAYEQADGSLALVSNPGDVDAIVLRGMAGQERVAASGFEEGINVIDATLVLSDDQRYSEYQAYRFAFDPFAEAGTEGNLIATATDSSVARHRRKIILMEQGHAMGLQNAIDRAGWEASRRWGRGRAVRITTDSWRDRAGRLYEPNTLAELDLPTLKLNRVLWMIADVTYRKDESGTRCDLLMMPPQAFAVQPTLPPYAIPAEVAQLPQNLGRP